MFNGVQRLGCILPEDPLPTPSVKVAARAGVAVLGLGIGGRLFAEDEPDDVMGGCAIEPLLLLRVNDIIGRGDHAAQFTDDFGIVAERAEGMNLRHQSVSARGDALCGRWPRGSRYR